MIIGQSNLKLQFTNKDFTNLDKDGGERFDLGWVRTGDWGYKISDEHLARPSSIMASAIVSIRQASHQDLSSVLSRSTWTL